MSLNELLEKFEQNLDNFFSDLPLNDESNLKTCFDPFKIINRHDKINTLFINLTQTQVSESINTLTLPHDLNTLPEKLENLEIYEEFSNEIFNLHSLVTSQLPDDFDCPFRTADDLINEFELLNESQEFMFIYEDDEALDEYQHIDCIMTDSYKKLTNLDMRQLTEFLEEYENIIQNYSAVLVQELAYREELLFEREQKDIFVERFHAIQKFIDKAYHRYSLVDNLESLDFSEPSVNLINYQKYSGLMNSPDFSQIGESKVNIDKVLSPDELMNKNKSVHKAVLSSALEAASSAASAFRDRIRRRDHSFENQPTEDEQTDPSNTSKTNRFSRIKDWAIHHLQNSALNKNMIVNNNNNNGPFENENVNEKRFSLNLFSKSQTCVTESDREEKLTSVEKTANSTIIPYHKTQNPSGGPELQNLVAVNELLKSILENNPNLSNQLTEYILNVYAPIEETNLSLPIL